MAHLAIVELTVELTTSTVSGVCYTCSGYIHVSFTKPVDCRDGNVRLLDGNVDRYILDDGDVQGVINVCEDQRWKMFKLCETEWTLTNTLVACRQLGYAAAGWLHLTRFH